MPALLMSTSRWPYRLATSAAAFLMLAGSATSSNRGSTRPALLSFFAAALAFAASLAVSRTTNPRLANCRQTSNPIPRLAPVTKAMRDGFVVIRRQSSRQNGCFTVAGLLASVSLGYSNVFSQSAGLHHSQQLSGGLRLTQARSLRASYQDAPII